jgi:hypothetical protein
VVNSLGRRERVSIRSRRSGESRCSFDRPRAPARRRGGLPGPRRVGRGSRSAKR